MAKILAINNDSKVVETLQKAVQNNGYELVEIDELYEGLKYAVDNPVDVIVINALNGYKATEEIIRDLKSRDSTREIPILFTFDYFAAKERDIHTYDKALRATSLSNIESDYQYEQKIKKLLAQKEKPYSGKYIPLDTLIRPYYENVILFFYTESLILMQHWFGFGFDDPSDGLFVFELEPNDDFKRVALETIKSRLHFMPSGLEYIDKYFRYSYEGSEADKGQVLYLREDSPREIPSYRVSDVYYIYKAPFPGFDAFKDYVSDFTQNKVNLFLATPSEAKMHNNHIDGEIIDSLVSASNKI